MTGGPVVFAELIRGRLSGTAHRHRVRATGMEAAARGRVRRARDAAAQADAPAPPFRVRHRRRGEQRLRVGVPGVREYVGGGAFLDDPAEVEDGDALAGLGHEPEVVADEHDGQHPFFAQREQEIEDLGLNGHVEGGGRLVGDD